jgi:exonuclease SbcD
MKFRILHTSDWHLGQNFYGKSRAGEHQRFLDWLLAQVSEHDIDAVIVAGDIFDTGTPPSYAREMYFDFIVNMHEKNCQLIILAGNHDSVAMLGESKQLLSHLSCQVIASVGDNLEEQIITLNNKKGQPGAILCAIPFIRPRDITSSSAGQSVKVKQQSLQQAISEHYQKLYQQAQEIAGYNKAAFPIIASGHLTTVGVTSSESVRDIYIGTLEAFPANAFPEADYIALGHIHRSQRVAKSDHIRYSGSPIALSFDEASQTKKVLIAEFDQAKLNQVIEQDIPCFQPLLMVKSKLETLTDDINRLVEELDYSKTLIENDQKIWLDIEINSAEYLQDLTPRIEALVKELPVEVLLVRRSKKSRQSMPESQKKITLNELSLSDVFETRLLQENWQTEKEVSQKIRLEQMFAQTIEQVQEQIKEQSTPENIDVEKSKTAGETK